jgi:hypothetical protein
MPRETFRAEQVRRPATVMENPCSPAGMVVVSGDLHIVISATEDRRGGFHFGMYSNSKFTGETLVTPPATADTYQGSTTKESTLYLDQPSSTRTENVDTELVSQGSAENTLARVRLHYTVNGNGSPTATVDQVTLARAYRLEVGTALIGTRHSFR